MPRESRGVNNAALKVGGVARATALLEWIEARVWIGELLELGQLELKEKPLTYGYKSRPENRAGETSLLGFSLYFKKSLFLVSKS